MWKLAQAKRKDPEYSGKSKAHNIQLKSHLAVEAFEVVGAGVGRYFSEIASMNTCICSGLFARSCFDMLRNDTAVARTHEGIRVLLASEAVASEFYYHL